nr:reverse transcriptase domain-containing protein [Tanacetum cinerariifolium]
MQTRSSSKLSRNQTFNPTSSTNPTPKGRIRRSSKQKVENSNFEGHLPPVATMTDNRTMVEMLRAPTEGCAEAIVVLSIITEQFELKHSLINVITSEQFFGLKKDNLHDHIRWGSPPVARKRTPAFTELHQLDTFYNALNPAEQDSLNAAAGGNLLEKSPQDALMIIENKYKQTSAVTTAMTTMLKQLQANPPPAPVKAVEEICVTCEGAHPYYQCLATGGNTFPEFRDNIQGYVSAAASNYNQGNPGYHPQ